MIDEEGARPTGNVIHIELVTIRLVFSSVALFSIFLEIRSNHKQFQQQYKTT